MNWINCKERKPFTEYGESDSVLTVDTLGVMRVAYWDGGNWCMPDGEIIETAAKFPITHWKPLPECPEAEPEIHEPERVYTLSFTVTGTMAHLKALKEYITNSGMAARWRAIRTIGHYGCGTILPQ